MQQQPFTPPLPDIPLQTSHAPYPSTSVFQQQTFGTQSSLPATEQQQASPSHPQQCASSVFQQQLPTAPDFIPLVSSQQPQQPTSQPPLCSFPTMRKLLPTTHNKAYNLTRKRPPIAPLSARPTKKPRVSAHIQQPAKPAQNLFNVNEVTHHSISVG